VELEPLEEGFESAFISLDIKQLRSSTHAHEDGLFQISRKLELFFAGISDEMRSALAKWLLRCLVNHTEPPGVKVVYRCVQIGVREDSIIFSFMSMCVESRREGSFFLKKYPTNVASFAQTFRVNTPKKTWTNFFKQS
jgi:hypothetical protein